MITSSAEEIEMGKGRDIIFYALAYILGDVLWQVFLPSPGIPAFIALAVLLAAAVSYCIALTGRKDPAEAPSCLLLLCFVLLGASGAVAGGIPCGTLPVFQKAAALKIKISGLLDGLTASGNVSEAAIAKALAIGDKSLIDSALRNQYKASGAMHLLALSGLHVGVVYTFLNTLLSFLGNSAAAKAVRKLLALSTLWAFALISGLSSSICRAVIMITVYEIGGFAGAGRNLLHSLAVSALLICLFNPDAPFGIGFQLSYSAVVGIFFIYPRLKALLDYRSPILGYIWNTLCLSISCQAVTSPLAFLYFGTFPKYFLVTNLLAIPLSSAAMWLLPITIAARNIPFIGVPGGKILLGILKTLNQVISIIASL